MAWTGTGKTDKLKIYEDVLAAVEDHRINLSKLMMRKRYGICLVLRDIPQNG